MLPYGALWRLDHMLHPAGPPRHRTPAQRRRAAFFYFVVAAALLSVFLIPFHFAALRRLRIEKERELRGEALSRFDFHEEEKKKAEILRYLLELRRRTAASAAPSSELMAIDVTREFQQAVYYQDQVPSQPLQLIGEPVFSKLAGDGAGTQWPIINSVEKFILFKSDSTKRNLGSNGSPVERSDRGFSPSIESVTRQHTEQLGSQRDCLLSIRRSFLPAAPPLEAMQEIDRIILDQFTDIAVAPHSISGVATASSPLHRLSVNLILAKLLLWVDRQPGRRIDEPPHGGGAATRSWLDAAVESCTAPFFSLPGPESKFLCLCTGKKSHEIASEQIVLVDPSTPTVPRGSKTCSELCQLV